MTKYQYKSISAHKLKCVQRKTQVQCGGGRASVPRNITSASSAGQNSHNHCHHDNWDNDVDHDDDDYDDDEYDDENYDNGGFDEDDYDDGDC